MTRIHVISCYPRNRVKQDLYPSVSAAFEHFRQTGEAVFESKPSNSYDFGSDEDVTKVDLDAVPGDSTLLDAFLLNHGEKSRQELNKDAGSAGEGSEGEGSAGEGSAGEGSAGEGFA